MVTQEQKKNWYLQTQFLILETELHDNKFRLRHNCNCPDRAGTGKRWFCEKLIKSRMRNKELRKKWMENAFDSPYMQESEFLHKVANRFYS